jgi:hypothetical protein
MLLEAGFMLLLHAISTLWAHPNVPKSDRRRKATANESGSRVHEESVTGMKIK